MPRYFYSELAPGVKALGAAAAGGSGTRSRGYRSGMADLANVDYLMARADEARAKAAGAQKELEASEDPFALIDAAAIGANVPIPDARRWEQGIRGVVDPMSSNDDRPTLDPALEKALRTGLADLLTQRQLTGKTNFEQFRAGQRQGVRGEASRRALDMAEGDPATDDFARVLSVAAEKEISPFSTNAQGTVVDQFTGDLEEGGELAQAFRDNLESKSGYYDAKADQAHAKATGQGALAPAEIRTFEAYQRIFPDKTPAEILSIVKSKRTEDPETSRDKTRRELIKAHPRWTPQQINEWVDQLTPPAEKKPPAAAKAPPRPTNVPPGSLYSPSRKKWKDPAGNLYDERGSRE